MEQGILQSVTKYHATGDPSAFRIEASLEFGPDFPAFQGHFPGNPILPGIVQLACVRMLAARFLETHLFSAALSNIKFREMVRPGQSVDVYVSATGNDGGWKVKFEISSSETPIASGDMRLVLTDELEG